MHTNTHILFEPILFNEYEKIGMGHKFSRLMKFSSE